MNKLQQAVIDGKPIKNMKGFVKQKYSDSIYIPIKVTSIVFSDRGNFKIMADVAGGHGSIEIDSDEFIENRIELKKIIAKGEKENLRREEERKIKNWSTVSRRRSALILFCSTQLKKAHLKEVTEETANLGYVNSSGDGDLTKIQNRSLSDLIQLAMDLHFGIKED